MNQLPETVFKRWIHSREEDSPGIQVYRPPSYSFPASRGRTGFEISPDGGFLRIDIGAADGQRGIRGQWRVEPDQRVHITYGDGREEILTIISVDDEVLKIRTEPR
jgi:hypothetical protein